jgi:eukaryotic-like serine/threonine-protein kinase
LPAGVLLQPVSQLAADLRAKIQTGDGDYALSRVNARALTKVLSRESAALVELFSEPTTIARAIARFSRGKPESPERLLERALPFLQALIAEGLLAKAGSPESRRLEPSLPVGSNVFGWTVLACMQTSEDVELYQMRGSTGAFAALKIGRRGVADARSTLEREARIAAQADDVAGRVLQSGNRDGCPYVLLEWLRGANAHRVFAEFQGRADAGSRARVRDLGGAVLTAYARLHERGILHGDVHPRNVLIDVRGCVALVDFGSARLLSESVSGAPRGGVGFFLEPEFAAETAGGHHNTLTAAGEQYSLAAMLYLLVTGEYYLDFALGRDAMLRQIAEEPVVPFDRRKVAPWPAAEYVLTRALSKHPDRRFASVREFAIAWANAEVPRRSRNAARAKTSDLAALPPAVLSDAAIDGAYMRDASAPTCSLNHGSAGVAYGLFRIACATGSADALALADIWSERALRGSGEPGAFDNPELEITVDDVDPASPYHGPGGAHLVCAMIAGARGDAATACTSALRYIEMCKRPFRQLDLTFGLSGALLGSALLVEVLEGLGIPAVSMRNSVRLVGSDLLECAWGIVESYAAVGESAKLDSLGIAHGWAGLLYATCCWCSVARTPLPDAFEMRARELAVHAEPIDRGLRWHWERGFENGNIYMPGWCNGSAGYVFLWDEAYGVTGDTTYLDFAEGAAWNAWESGVGDPSLCCGATGQAYAMLRWYRRCGDAVWLRRAYEAALRGARAAGSRRPHELADQDYWHPGSLYRGNVGLAVLAADLARPRDARMPMFECAGLQTTKAPVESRLP